MEYIKKQNKPITFNTKQVRNNDSQSPQQNNKFKTVFNTQNKFFEGGEKKSSEKEEQKIEQSYKDLETEKSQNNIAQKHLKKTDSKDIEGRRNSDLHTPSLSNSNQAMKSQNYINDIKNIYNQGIPINSQRINKVNGGNSPTASIVKPSKSKSQYPNIVQVNTTGSNDFNQQINIFNKNQNMRIADQTDSNPINSNKQFQRSAVVVNSSFKKNNLNTTSMDRNSNIDFHADSAISETNNSINYIDLESQKLSTFQARAIRNQIKKDCELLKNRVRMLQQEMQRARKKIEETKKKTYEIQVIKEENEKKYKEKLLIQSENEEERKKKMEQRMKLQQDIKEKRYQMFLEKRKENEIFKIEKSKQKELFNSYREENFQQNFQRKLLIRQQQEKGNEKRKQFLEEKRRIALRERDSMLESQKNDIYAYEREAEELEKLEAQLLRELQMTQQRETDVFGKLKSVLIDSSLPKKQRVEQSFFNKTQDY